MSTKSSYVNNFTVTIQNFNCILDAKCTAPNIEKTGYDTPPVFDAHKIVDENHLIAVVTVSNQRNEMAVAKLGEHLDLGLELVGSLL